MNLQAPRLGGMVDGDTLGRAVHAQEMSMAKIAFAILYKHYPGHHWVTRANLKAQLLSVQIYGLMDSTRWYNMHLDQIGSDHALDEALMLAAGELLERFGLKRKGIIVDDFLHARATKSLRNHNDPTPEG